MPTLRDNAESFDLDSNLEPYNKDTVTVEEPRQSITSEPARKSRKVQVPLTTDGRIDIELLNSSQRPKIERAIALEVEARIKSSQSEAKPIIQFNKEYVPTVLDALAIVIRGSLNLTRKFGLHQIPGDFIQFIKYNDEQKKKLAEPTARLIEKHVPPKYLQNQELANFVLAFGTVTQEMLTNAGTSFLMSKGLTEEQIQQIKNGTLVIQTQPPNGYAQPDAVVAN